MTMHGEMRIQKQIRGQRLFLTWYAIRGWGWGGGGEGGGRLMFGLEWGVFVSIYKFYFHNSGWLNTEFNWKKWTQISNWDVISPDGFLPDASDCFGYVLFLRSPQRTARWNGYRRNSNEKVDPLNPGRGDLSVSPILFKRDESVARKSLERMDSEAWLRILDNWTLQILPGFLEMGAE